MADFELILIDDGSPDNCGAVCDEYAQKDSRIHVIHQRNGGLSAARNAGIDWAFANSDSQWLTFIDSDDWVHPEYLSTLYKAAISTNLPLSICGFIRTSGEEPIIDTALFDCKIRNSESFFVEHNVNAIIACSKLYKKESFKSIRYPVGKIHEDEFITYKNLFSIENVAVVEAPLYYYYQNNNGITGSPWTPKHLIILPATAERLHYLKKHNLKQAYAWQVPQYFSHANGLLNKVIRYTDAPISKSDLRLVHKHFRKALRLCRRSQELPFRNNQYLYEKTYPRLMKLYWFIKTLQSKLS